MRERQPETQTIKSSEVRQQWSRLVNEVFRGETRVVVEKSGIPVAAIISADDLARFQHLEEQRQRDFQALKASWEAFDDVPPEELEREVARVIAAVRQENRQQEQRLAPGA